jgi:predicted  nucleic acid-binding Zn-ribbon protein
MPKTKIVARGELKRAEAQAKSLRKKIASLKKLLKPLNKLIRADREIKQAAKDRASRRQRELEWISDYARTNGLTIQQARKQVREERAAARVDLEAEKRRMAELAARVDLVKIRAEEEAIFKRYTSGELDFYTYEASIASLNERIRAGEFDRQLH